MIAGSLLLGRALAPIDMLVGSWKGFSLARAHYYRLRELLEHIPARADTMRLPAPAGQLTVDRFQLPPGSQALVVRGVTFELALGKLLAWLGRCFRQIIAGARSSWHLAKHRGKVRLDGADVGHGTERARALRGLLAAGY